MKRLVAVLLVLVGTVSMGFACTKCSDCPTVISKCRKSNVRGHSATPSGKCSACMAKEAERKEAARRAKQEWEMKSEAARNWCDANDAEHKDDCYNTWMAPEEK